MSVYGVIAMDRLAAARYSQTITMFVRYTRNRLEPDIAYIRRRFDSEGVPVYDILNGETFLNYKSHRQAFDYLISLGYLPTEE